MSETGQRTLAAIVFTDAVEYSTQVGRDEDASVRAIRADLELMSQLTRQFEGRVLKSMGDGLMLIFNSAVNAVSCALEIQKTFEQRAKENPEATAFLHRIGVHLGDVLVVDNDAHGDGVNVASRLQERAEPGGICLSQTVYDVVKGRLFLQAIPLGELALKHVAEPVAAYRVAGVAPARKEPKKLPAWAAVAAGLTLLVSASATTAYLVSNRTQPVPVVYKADTAELDKKIAELSRIAAEIDRKSKAAADSPAKLTANPVPLKSEAKAQTKPQAPKTETTPAASPKPKPKAWNPRVESPKPPPPDVVVAVNGGDLNVEGMEDFNEKFKKYDFGKVARELDGLPHREQFKPAQFRFQKLDGLMSWVKEEAAEAAQDKPIPFPAFGPNAFVVGGDQNSLKIKVNGKVMDHKFRELSPGQMVILMQSLVELQPTMEAKMKALESVRVFTETFERRFSEGRRNPSEGNP